MYPKNLENAREVDGWSAQPQWQFVLSTMVRSSAVKSAASKPPLAAETAAKVCESNSTNQHQHWRSGPHWWVPKFHMFSDVYIDVNIDLCTFL